MDNNFGDSLITNRKGPEPHDFALLAVLTAHCARLAMSVISILELASNCYISDIIDIVHHMMDTHHMMDMHHMMDTHHMMYTHHIMDTYYVMDTHHMMDVHHIMNTHYDDEHPSYVGQPS